MSVEEEYPDLLQNIEFVIVSICRREPMLVDFDVENAVNGLVANYQAQAQSHEPRLPKLNERARDGLRLGRDDMRMAAGEGSTL